MIKFIQKVLERFFNLVLDSYLENSINILYKVITIKRIFSKIELSINLNFK